MHASISAKVIESGLDAVMRIDTDLIIPPDALVRLVQMSRCGTPIAAGIYRRPCSTSPLPFRHHWTNGDA